MVQITKYKNFLKIDVEDGALLSELEESIDNNNYNSKFAYEMKRLAFIFTYDISYGKKTNLSKQTVYYFEDDYSLYVFSSKNGDILLCRCTYFDDNNPYNESDLDEHEPKYDKFYHIDDIDIRIDNVKKEYFLNRYKHGLYHHSTFFGKHYSPSSGDFYLKNREYMLSVANKFFEDVRNIENIESIIDLSAFDVVPTFQENKSSVYKKVRRNS